MKKHRDHLYVKIKKDRKRLSFKAPLDKVGRVVLVFNDQYTNAPNTTQLASGAGGSSAAGSNAAIKSPHTNQQDSIGAGGKAINLELKDSRKKSKDKKHHTDKGHHKHEDHSKKEIVVVFNKQKVKLPKNSQNASATQVASGAGTYSTGGTNSAIESADTRQQLAVGGGRGSKAINKGSKLHQKKHSHSKPNRNKHYK